MNTPLTEEHFEQILTQKLTPLATKQGVRDGVEELARIVTNTIANPLTERFDHLEKLLEVKEECWF